MHKGAMHKIALAAALALPVSGLLAQDPGGEASAKKEYDEIVKELTAADAAYAKAIRAIIATDAYQEAKKTDRQAAIAMTNVVERVDRAAFVKRFAQGAAEYAGTDDAVPYLTWIALYSRDEDAINHAVDELMARHIDSRHLVPFAENLPYAKPALGAARFDEVCSTLIDKSRHNVVRGWAMYWPVADIERRRDASMGEKVFARRTLEEIRHLVPGSLLVDRINARAFRAERLQIGMEAPDIAGEDIDGVKFKLSDYRGKVVVLDFWGDW